MCSLYICTQVICFSSFWKWHSDSNLHKTHQGGKEYSLVGLTPVSTDLVLSGSQKQGLGCKEYTLPSRSTKKDSQLYMISHSSGGTCWRCGSKVLRKFKGGILLFLTCRSEKDSRRPHKRSTVVSVEEWANLLLISITGGRTIPKNDPHLLLL